MRKSNEVKHVIWKSTSVVTLIIELYYKSSLTADSIRNIIMLLSFNCIHSYVSCQFQLNAEFYSATTSLRKRPHFFCFCINIQKLGIKSFSKVLKIRSAFKQSKAHLKFVLTFVHTLNFFQWLFHFSIYMSCLLPSHPVIFTSCYLYCAHVVEYFWAPIRNLLLFGNKK